VYAADIDADGDVDICGASSGGDGVAWWENVNGSGTNWAPHAVSNTFNTAKSVFVADVDGDGDLDVLGASEEDDDVAWWENKTIHRSAVFPVAHVVDGSFNGAWSVFATDVDGDGDPDVLGAAENANDVTWWENTDGHAGAWSKHIVDGLCDGARSASGADIDGDGDADVLGVAIVADIISWWENTNGGTGGWWPEHLVETNVGGVRMAVAGDVDGDGDLDVLGVAFDDDQVVWWENTDGSGTNWSKQSVESNFVDAISVHAADLNGDGRLDILGAARGLDDVVWWDNVDGTGMNWNKYTVDNEFDGARAVYAADLDADGDMDVLAAGATVDTLAWWENLDGMGTAWTGRIVTHSFGWPLVVMAADMDADGDADVVSAAHDGDAVAWWENVGGSGTNWLEHTIDNDVNGATSVFAVDLDRDGDVDVLGASRHDSHISWWENQGGQFALATEDTAPSIMVEGDRDDMLRIEMAHRGRVGDTDEELAALQLLFEESPGDPLSQAEANALIEQLHVYRDDGSGTFEDGVDTLVETVTPLTLSGGTQTVTLADGSPDAAVPFGGTLRLFAVVDLTADAGTNTPNQFLVTHITETTSPAPSGAVSRAEDRDHDIPLTLEPVTNVASRAMWIASYSVDFDGDGLPDAWEWDHFDDLTNALAYDDGDGDTFFNIGEYTADTNPNDSNSFLRVESVLFQNTLEVFFESSAERNYTLQYSDDIIGDTWTDHPPQSDIPGNDSLMALTNSAVTNARSFRIQVEVP